MTESQFVSQNIDKWRELEELLKSDHIDPDKLQYLFIKVSGDLSYAKTFYPNRSVRVYLNSLTQSVFNIIDKKKSVFSLHTIKNFFSEILPYELFCARKELLYAFIIFSFSVLIGVVSTLESDQFPRMILGDSYVNMTEENINDGDPMRVYKDSGQNEMFLYITSNNIKVSFLAFVLGILGSLGTAIILINNGIMLGAFQCFFYKKGLFLTSFMTIWIHGTIEISAIIIAGAAGFVLGRGLLFPGSFTRSSSLQKSVLKSVRIIVGIIPLFVIAGFLESFVTRLTEMPTFGKIVIILGSLFLIVGLYILYPYYKFKNNPEKNYDIKPGTVEVLNLEMNKVKSFAEVFSSTMAFVRINFGVIFSKIIIPSTILCCISYSIWISLSNFRPNSYQQLLRDIEFGGMGLFFIYWFLTAHIILLTNLLITSSKNFAYYYKKAFLPILCLCFFPVFILYSLPTYTFLLFLIMFPPQTIFSLSYHLCHDDENAWQIIRNNFRNSYINYFGQVLPIGIVLLIHLALYSGMETAISSLLLEFLSWHDIFSNQNISYIFFLSLIVTIINAVVLVMYQSISLNTYFSSRANLLATDLKEKLLSFGSSQKKY